MESALRPRDIQARIRAGESPDDVARAAGVPLERIAAFADPVIAERDYIAGLARTHPVRRRGETTSHRTLRNAIADALSARNLDFEATQWDAWKLEDRRWQVRVGFEQDGTAREGLFVFDATGRFSVAANDEARALIGDGGTDQLALVHATQGSGSPTSGEEPEDAGFDDDDAEDAFHEGDLQEVDGVFDIVAPARGELDILYDMLSSFDEDSVKIYAGLVHPKEATPGHPGTPVTPAEDEGGPDEPAVPDEPAKAPDEPARAPRSRSAKAEQDQPEQLALVEDVDAPAPRPKPRRKRASVPSWDEIMFGGPRPEE